MYKFGKHFVMIYAIICYCLTTILFIIAKNCKNYATKLIPEMKICKHGITFFSYCRHKIRVEQTKILILNNNVFLKQNNNTIEIKNVKNVILKKNYIYFSALGNVEVLFNAEPIYRYFNIKILSNDFSLEELKQQALLDIINNLFNLDNCSKLRQYLKIVIKILNISITNNRITVKKNNFNLKFTLIYKINNTIKKINIGESF